MVFQFGFSNEHAFCSEYTNIPFDIRNLVTFGGRGRGWWGDSAIRFLLLFFYFTQGALNTEGMALHYCSPNSEKKQNSFKLLSHIDSRKKHALIKFFQIWQFL